MSGRGGKAIFGAKLIKIFRKFKSINDKNLSRLHLNPYL